MGKPLSPERLKVWTDQMEAGVAELYDSRRYADYLSAMSKFHQYSYGNIILILQQCPHAQQVAGYHKWKNTFGRQVKRYETGITILAPCKYKCQVKAETAGGEEEPVQDAAVVEKCRFRTATVFDVSQTVGKELPSLGVEQLTGSVSGYASLIAALKEISPVPVDTGVLRPGAYGCYSHVEERITIQKGLTQVQTVKTLIHEIAHARLHTLPVLNGVVMGSHEKSRPTREIEAESVAYVVCQYLGIDTSEYSLGYVAGWGRDREMKAFKSSLACIRNTAAELINGIASRCPEIGRPAAREEHPLADRTAAR